MRPAPLLGLVLAAAACRSATEPPRVAEGHALFDGRTLAGWEGDARFWRVEDGAIVGESTAANPCTETSYLFRRDGEASDFVLELEWRFPGALPGANSGVQFRSLARSTSDVTGYQADLETGPDWTGGLYEQGGRGVVTRRGERVVLDASGGKRSEPLGDGAALLALVRPGEWSRLRVTALGPRLTLEVNGHLFSETIDLDPARARRAGTFALQLHAGPPVRVEFRGLVVRPLEAEPTAAWPASDAPAAPALVPTWIWPPGPVADGQVAWFRRRFELAAAPAKAELWISGDNHFDAWLGGQGVATSDEWTRPLLVDVTSFLAAGDNELLVCVENDEAQAGLVLELRLEHADGSRSTLVSDTAFEACLEPAAGVPEAARGAWLGGEAPWVEPQSFGALGVAPWGTLGSALALGGEAPAGETITVPPGFAVERLYSVPLASQGSWVALTADPRGRLYASDQYGGLFRITVPPPGMSGDVRVEPVPIALGEANGLVWAFDSLYAVVCGGGEFTSGLYRVRDTDGDDAFDEVRCLRVFEGDGEHGPHGIVAHPDGRSLVIMGGNHTKLPEPFTRSRVPRHWAEDVLLAPIDDPGGHAVGILAPGGWVVRTDPEGREWELFAAGFRNAYDVAFDAEGELFTYDSDMEWDVGLPWYKPTRILHVVSGADYGWRAGSANWPADSLDAWPAALDLGLASPTGIVFGNGTSFPEPWRSALFACDWAYGRVHAVFLEPEGASYRGRHELFASGQPFPVTDICVGGDGALYLAIGGRQAQSGLYRISWQGSPVLAPAVARGLPDAHALRRELEDLQVPATPEASVEALALRRLVDALRVPDPFVRHAARVGLELRSPASWAELVRAEREPRAVLEGWLALVRSDPTTDAREACEAAQAVLVESTEPTERLDALRLIELVLLRLAPRDAERVHLRLALDPLYPSGDARFDRTLLGLLVALDADVAGRALAELERAPTQEERVGILYALRVLEAHWDTPAGEARARTLLAACEVEVGRVQGGASVVGYLERIRDEVRAHTGLASEPASAPPPTGSVPTAALSGPARAWSLAELEPRLSEVRAERDFGRGRAAYERASCAQCHRMAGEGANLGPDLTGAAGRYSPRDLLVAILEPSREVPDVWRDLEFWGDAAFGGDERLLAVGRLEAESADELVVLETAGTHRRLASSDVGERRVHRLSRMPEGLLACLSAEEILDLLAYVLAGGDAAEARFR
jgi:putative heme-binding domain-containing protein